MTTPRCVGDRRRFVTVIVLVALAISACSHTTKATSWPAFAPVDLPAPLPNVGDVPSPIPTRCDLGLNYPWLHFGGDFGGVAAWNQHGVSSEVDTHRTRLRQMAALGATRARWWVFPDFRGDAIERDARGHVTGVSRRSLDDLAAALDLLDELNLDVQFCLFSFDGFRPDRTEAGVLVPTIRPFVVDPVRRSELVDRVVVPFVRAASEHPHASRVLTWEIINEPEWAMRGAVPTGVLPLSPTKGLAAVSVTEMQSFVAEIGGAIHRQSAARISIGSARAGWAGLWSRSPIDEISIHVYDTPSPPSAWIPFDRRGAVSVGELPLAGVGGVPFDQVAKQWRDAGAHGVFGWRFDGSSEADRALFKSATSTLCPR